MKDMGRDSDLCRCVTQREAPRGLPGQRDDIARRQTPAPGEGHTIAESKLVESFPCGPVGEQHTMIRRSGEFEAATRPERDRFMVADDVTVVHALRHFPVANHRRVTRHDAIH
jgi:hypothetical protein